VAPSYVTAIHAATTLKSLIAASTVLLFVDCIPSGRIVSCGCSHCTVLLPAGASACTL
jgi:hypothetical protein